MKPLYQAIAGAVAARENCIASGNAEWKRNHEIRADELAAHHLPHGSGFDSGILIDWSSCTSEKLVFLAPFHHMNDGGMYDGWTHHKIIVRASLAFGYSLRVDGINRNQIKEYIADTVHAALGAMVDEYRKAAPAAEESR